MKKRLYAIFMVIALMISNIPMIATANVFSDVPDDYIYRNDIGFLSNLGIIEGVGDGLFLPDSNVKRCDFVIMLSRLLEIPDSDSEKFSDVLPEHYFYEYVTNAKAAGIISGYGDGSFLPDNNITMQEAVKMAVAAYEKTSGISMQISKDSISDRADSWASGYCDKAATANMIDESFVPQKLLTRGEAARMLSGLVLYMGESVEGDYEQETTIVQKQRGNIFTDCDEAPTIEVKTGYPVIETIAKDFWGNAVVHRYDKVSDDAVTLTFEELDFGHYYIDIYGRDDKGNRSLLADTTISYLKKFEASAPSENPFGVNFHAGRANTGWYPDLIYEASLIGVKHVRDEWYWTSVEKQKGVYTNYLQKLTDLCREYRIAFEPVCGFQAPYYDNNVRPYTDDGRTGFANVVNAYYDLLDDRELFSRVEMYNEWWNPNTAKGSPAGYQDLTYLRALQEKTQEIVKKNHPEAVLLGMIAGNPCDFTDNYFKVGCGLSADEISIHRYPSMINMEEAKNGERPESVPEQQIDELYEYWSNNTREYLGKELGRDIKWGMTETGYPVDFVDLTEHYQGVNYPRLFIAILHYNPEYAHAYDLLCDGNNDLYKEHNFGLLNAQNSKHGSYTGRPAYVAFGVTSRMIDNKDGVEKELKDNIYHYTFKKNDDILHTFNTARYDNQTIAIYTDTSLSVTDCMGQSREFSPVDGKIYLTLSEDVVYVQGDIKSWKVAENVEFENPERHPCIWWNLK